MIDLSVSVLRHQRQVGAIVLTSALLLAGCGASGSSDAAPPTTASVDPVATTAAPETSAAPDPTTTTTEPTDEITMEDLEAILPTVEDIGPEFEESPPPKVETFLVAAVARQCPDGVDFLGGANDDAASVAFTGANGANLDFRFSLADQTPEPAAIQALVDGLNDCGPMGISSSDGSSSSITLAAGVEDSLGDQAMRVGMSLSTQAEGESEGLTLNTYIYVFWLDGVLTELRFGEGSEAGERVKVDPADLNPVIREIEQRVQDLADR